MPAPEQDFKPLAIGVAANVVTQAEYEALLLADLLNGYVAGLAQSDQVNKTLRQSSVIAYAVAQFMADTLGVDIKDDGDVAALLAQFKSAIFTKASPIQWAVGAGAADAITAAFPIAITALTDGLIVGVRGLLPNATHAPTLKVDSTPAHTITKNGGVVLSIADVNTLGEYLFRYNLANTRWELMNPSGGAPATGIILLNAQDAAGSASMVFDISDPLVDCFELEISRLTLADPGWVGLQFSKDDGASWVADGYRTNNDFPVDLSGNQLFWNGVNGALLNSIVISAIDYNGAAGVPHGPNPLAGKVKVYTPWDAVFRKNVNFETGWYGNAWAGPIRRGFGSGAYTTDTDAFTRMRIVGFKYTAPPQTYPPDPTNINTGRFTLRGLRRA